MKKPVVHKGVANIFIYNLCNNKVDKSKFSLKWKDVTCKRCLALKEVKRESRTTTNEYTIPGRDGASHETDYVI